METVDIQKILNEVKIPPKFKPVYDKLVLNGKRLMFSKDMEQALDDLLDGDGDLAEKISKGVVAVMYMMWNQSGKKIPLEMIVPVTFTLTVEAFGFLQKAKDPDATKEVLGDAIDKSTTLVMQGFNVAPDQIKEFVGQNQAAMEDADANIDSDPAAPAEGAPPPAAAPAGGGMLTAEVPNA